MIEPNRRRRDLRLVLREGLAFSVMVGAGETYVAAFVLALGLGEVASGLIGTVPLLAGGAIQLVTPWAIRRLGSRRRWAVLCATIQAVAFLPLVAAALAGRGPAWIVFGTVILYWASGMAISPAWNAWMDVLVPRRLRVPYFARRTSLMQFGVVCGLLGGGAILQLTAAAGSPLPGFAAIFGVAALARLVSSRLLAAQSEAPERPRSEVDLPSALGALRRGPRGPASRLLAYLLALMAGVTVASPYFSAYMLAELELSYAAYMSLVGSSVLAKVVALPALAVFARRFGLAATLRMAWLGIAAVPALWLVSDAYPYLLALQVGSGAAWAAHEYASFLLIFETIRAERRVAVLTAFNFGNAVATVGGSVLGAWLFEVRGGGLAGYTLLFGLSTVLRVVAGVLLTGVADARVPDRPVAFRPTAVRPAVGAVLRPILATITRRPRGQ